MTIADLVTLTLATYYCAVTVARLHGPFGWAERFRHAIYRKRGFEHFRTNTIDEMTPERAIGRIDRWQRIAGTMARPRIDELSDDWITAGVGCPLCVSLYASILLTALYALGGSIGMAVVVVLAIAGGASLAFTLGRTWE